LGSHVTGGRPISGARGGPPRPALVVVRCGCRRVPPPLDSTAAACHEG
jgi:hypothetical protein